MNTGMDRHPVDGVSVGFGVAFLGLVAWWLLSRLVDLHAPGAGWFIAGALLLAGVLGLVATLRSGRRGRTTPDA